MGQITDSLPGIIVIHDGICIYGRNTAEHNQHLLQLMTTASQQGLVFSSSECSIWQPQVTFYGAIFTTKGMKPNPFKVEALQGLATTKNQAKLQSFFGLINYLQAFLPSIASKTTVLHEQVTQQEWTSSTDKTFHSLKSWICNTLFRTTLAYYDCT